jgi:hypothetical protein
VGTYYGGAARYDPTSGTGSLEEAGSLSAYPVPASDIVNVIWPGSAAAGTWRATDMTGRTFAEGNLASMETVSIPVHAWPPGPYMLNFTAGGIQRAVRILVQ